MNVKRILATVLTCVMVLAAVVIGLQGKPVSRDDSLYITDKAGVISNSEEIRFAQLQRQLTPRLTVAIVKSTGRLSTAAYCEALWNNWRLGSSDMLLLMVTVLPAVMVAVMIGFSGASPSLYRLPDADSVTVSSCIRSLYG